MLKIDEENCFRVKTTVQRQPGRTPHVYIARALEDQDVELATLRDVELCLDRKNKVVFFKYGMGEQ